MVPSFSSIGSALLLGALWSSVSAEAVESLGKRAAPLSPREVCDNPSWIPACPGFFACIPPGGICCSDGIHYAMPPMTCPDGTEPVATAVTSNVVTTTRAPVSTLPPITEYTWYTWRFTYYYYYYYYTYFEFSTELVSTEKTYYTSGSLSATDDMQASSLIESLSAKLSYDVPTQTATPTSGSAPPTTLTSTPTPTATASPTAPSPTGNTTVPSGATATPPPFTGAAASLHTGIASYFGGVFVLVTGVFMSIPGLLMLWL